MRLLTPALAIAVCLGAVEARATVVAGTFSGFIDHGADYAGVFGAANATLDGLAYVTTFTYDTSKGWRATTATADQVGAFAPQEPVLTYSLTINGVTETLDLRTDNFAAVVPGDDFRIGGELVSRTSFVQVGNIAYGSAFDDLDHPVSFLDMKVPPVPFNGFAQRYTGVGFTDLVYFMIFDTKRVDFVGAGGSGGGGGSGGVPEPATWSLLLTGFLGLGAAIRRRRHRWV